jgi:hypothetical protein
LRLFGNLCGAFLNRRRRHRRRFRGQNAFRHRQRSSGIGRRDSQFNLGFGLSLRGFGITLWGSLGYHNLGLDFFDRSCGSRGGRRAWTGGRFFLDHNDLAAFSMFRNCAFGGSVRDFVLSLNFFYKLNLGFLCVLFFLSHILPFSITMIFKTKF